MSTATDYPYPQFDIVEDKSNLDPDIKASWLEALRGDDYTQGYEALRINQEDGTHSYCCLGVLCDIVGPGNWADDGQFVFGSSLGDVTGAYPPPNVYDITGLSQTDSETLAGMNDTGNSYDEIADWIEENL